MEAAVRHGVYSAALWLTGRGSQLRHQRELRDTRFMPAAALRHQTDQRLARMLGHAYEHVPYYRRQWQEQGLKVDDIRVRPRAALAALPLLTKDILRRHNLDLRSDDLQQRRWYYNSSGGSTGEPVRFIQDQASQQQALAVKALFDEWSGYHRGMRKLLLWGSERDLLVGRETLRTHLGRWARNEMVVNTFDLSEADMANFVNCINRFRPVQILAYAESADQLARFIEGRHQGPALIPPKAVISSAGTLWPAMRERIQRVFGAPVFNCYGSREVGGMACECAMHQGLHVSPLTHRLEIINDEGRPAAPGETGEVVVTSLINFAMPLLRYRIGDRGAWAREPCGCGSHWPVLEGISGRTMDIFVTRGGRHIFGGFFVRGLLGRDWIKRFQYIQQDYERVLLLIEPAVSMEQAQAHVAAEKPELDNRVRKALGPDCRLQIRLVDAIAPTASGKHRYVISEMTTADVAP